MLPAIGRPWGVTASLRTTLAAIDLPDMTDATHLHQPWPEGLVRHYVAAGYWRGETFGELLHERAETCGGRIAVVGGATRWSYAELDRRASDIAAGLLARGLRRGDRVIVHLPNIPAFVSVVFGLFRAGLIPVYALPAHRIAEIGHFAVTGHARAYVCAGQYGGFDYGGLATTLQARCPWLEHGVVAQGEPGQHTALTEIERAGAGIDLPWSAAAAQDTAFLQASGGTTGLPKLIPRTHDDYIYTLRESARICGLTADSVFLCALPMAHNFPMSSPGFLGTLYAGGRVVLSPSPSPDVCFQLIAQERATFSSLVPPALLLWLEAARHGGHDLSSLRVIQVGGAKLIPEVARRVGPVLRVTLQQVFGMAEGLVNYTRLDDDEDTIIHTQGRPISPDDDILIVDEHDHPVAPGQPGHLLTRGPYTLRGYYNDPAANARAFTRDGHYRTGDIVRQTAEGYLVVEGRAGDHINRAGEKISAEEIEDHLLAHPRVFDAAVVSVPDAYLGERSCAFVIASDSEHPPRAVELKRWMRERGLAAFKVPDQIIFTPSFAATAALKTNRRALRAQLRAQLLQDGQTPSPGASP